MNRYASSQRTFAGIYADFLNFTGRTMVIAHRGDWKQAPENSLKALEHSIHQGVDMIEIDIKQTKDGVLVLSHDETVDRATNGSGKIDELTFAEIRALRLKQGLGGDGAAVTDEVMPTLEEALLLIKDRVMVNLDNCWDYREEVYQMVVKTGTIKHALFKSRASIDEVEQFLMNKDELPEYMYIIEDKSNVAILDQLDQLLIRIRPKAIEIVFQNDTSPIISESTLQQLRGTCRIWVNAMSPEDCGGHTDELSLTNQKLGWGWHTDRGVNMIQTDCSNELLEYLNTKEN
jgi:glycerophosphoryl diester phosphodiesterase